MNPDRKTLFADSCHLAILGQDVRFAVTDIQQQAFEPNYFRCRLRRNEAYQFYSSRFLIPITRFKELLS